ncbi:hypothetical protein [Agromyces larvae]|uniref:Capsular polysaccharide biosynthesis protein n=1 Tax=Agromyces larvae TaxID=2929802 RepID=A0ABY4BZJ8_9MICO|nr:hypothetical protein [Agromyces larvae]UOE44334.1 hypothetical protein MTO99_00625 [Agromyces larvae]
MDVPKYLQTLWSYRALLGVGIVVAVAAALLAGFTIKDGEVVSRADRVYTASTTVLLGSESKPLFQAEVPGVPIEQGTTPPEQLDLTSTAVVYAYLVSGTEISERVQAVVGEFADGELLTAVRRTTQPAGDESFPGRLTLPILDIVGASGDPERAEQISRTANDVFQKYVTSEQDAAKIPEENRVQLTTIKQSDAVEEDGSNPAIPIVVTGLGVFLLFVALAFLLDNVKRSRARRRGRPRAGAGATPDEASEASEALDERELHDVLTGSQPVFAGESRPD